MFPSLLSNRCGRLLLHRPALVANQFRTHMNHGGGNAEMKLPLDTPGPRTAGMEIGLDSATSLHNILRLLESSHGQYTHAFVGSAWHPKGQTWEYNANQGWNTITNDNSKEVPQLQPTTPARLLDLKFSDPRTALVKLVGGDGRLRYLSMVQLEDCKPVNDGWILVREVIGNKASGNRYCTTSFGSLRKTVHDYLSIEHGGGLEDKQAAQVLFHPEASLLAVGSDSQASDWSAPVGSLLEVSLSTYLNGVLSQTTQGFDVTKNDAIVSLDVLPCGTAAAATVRVGNGARTRVFEDHLLMGRCPDPSVESSSSADRYSWQILSKTFSPQAWPADRSLDEGEEEQVGVI